MTLSVTNEKKHIIHSLQSVQTLSKRKRKYVIIRDNFRKTYLLNAVNYLIMRGVISLYTPITEILYTYY